MISDKEVLDSLDCVHLVACEGDRRDKRYKKRKLKKVPDECKINIISFRGCDYDELPEQIADLDNLKQVLMDDTNLKRISNIPNDTSFDLTVRNTPIGEALSKRMMVFSHEGIPQHYQFSTFLKESRELQKKIKEEYPNINISIPNNTLINPGIYPKNEKEKRELETRLIELPIPQKDATPSEKNASETLLKNVEDKMRKWRNFTKEYTQSFRIQDLSDKARKSFYGKVTCPLMIYHSEDVLEPKLSYSDDIISKYGANYHWSWETKSWYYTLMDDKLQHCKRLIDMDNDICRPVKVIGAHRVKFKLKCLDEVMDNMNELIL